jgi:hypothetical protein
MTWGTVFAVVYSFIGVAVVHKLRQRSFLMASLAFILLLSLLGVLYYFL